MFLGFYAIRGLRDQLHSSDMNIGILENQMAYQMVIINIVKIMVLYQLTTH